jgi:hypothetical protein
VGEIRAESMGDNISESLGDFVGISRFVYLPWHPSALLTKNYIKGGPCVERPWIQGRHCKNLAAARMRSCVRLVDAASAPPAQIGSANGIQTILRP